MDDRPPRTLKGDEIDMVITACRSLAEQLRRGLSSFDSSPNMLKAVRRSADSYDHLANRLERPIIGRRRRRAADQPQHETDDVASDGQPLGGDLRRPDDLDRDSRQDTP